MLMVGSLLRFGSIAVWVFHIIARMGGCLGCDNRPQLISSIDEPLKGQNNNNNNVWKTSKSTVSEDFWTTSTCEMDNNLLQSCGSISSTATNTHDALGSGCSSKPSEFVNHGFILWDQSRKKWIGNKKPQNRAQNHQEPNLSWDATYESLLSNNKPFRKPIPLSEIVDFLVDIWEQEGMYD